jgi:acyl-CoA synthetase (NDP forming)
MRYKLSREKFKELEPIFYPRSIAVVGASINEQKTGSQWLKGLISAGFKGELYPVNPRGGEVFGLKIYRNLRSIPGPVDLVIVCTPRTSVLGVLGNCAAKGIKAVYFFTAGFRESGEPEWIGVEEEMVRWARRGGFRIIGPNCFGVYSPEHGIPYGPFNLHAEIGSVGFISQSSGHVGKILEFGMTRGVGFSKAISLGNGADLGSADFLEYLALDPRTNIIGLYVEGQRDSRCLFETIRAASETKPIVVWKGGRTPPGARATASHTGALAASADVWSGALKQAGAIEVQGLEELADTLLLFQRVARLERSNVSIICGLTDGGGGEAVLGADACAALGIEVPALTEKTGQELVKLLGKVGSVLCNPVDLSQRFGDPQALERAMELVAAEPYIDVIVVYENAGVILGSLSKERVDELNHIIVDFSQKQSKPILVVLPPGPAEMRRLEIERMLSQAGIPVYPSMERAAKAISNVNRYFRRHAGSSKSQKRP